MCEGSLNRIYVVYNYLGCNMPCNQSVMVMAPVPGASTRPVSAMLCLPASIFRVCHLYPSCRQSPVIQNPSRRQATTQMEVKQPFKTPPQPCHPHQQPCPLPPFPLPVHLHLHFRPPPHHHQPYNPATNSPPRQHSARNPQTTWADYSASRHPYSILPRRMF